ncbi:neuropeptide Y-like [Polyergus mexicanus]|uniref:neuropeptide Y-like n=1 Tax=Polyergus mexicanus TaxID=615972 RepID=UPI0038B532F3
MRTWMSLAHFSCCLLLAIVVGTSIIHAEPKSMTRLTRPKEIANSEDLKKYVNLVRDYYLSLAKARFGKRSDIAPMSTELRNWEILRMIQDARRQQKIRQNKEQVLFHDFRNIDKHTSRVATRPGSFSDMIDNYDDVQ